MLGWLDSLSGLVNSLSGLGGLRDKGARGAWYFTPLSDDQLEAAFRSNWMARKAVTIPAFDMLREGWDWQAGKADIEKIEAEERRHGVARKMTDALIKARLYGGAGMIISVRNADPAEPLDPEQIGEGDLEFLTVLSRRHLIAGDIMRDPMSPLFGRPEYYEISTGTGGMTRIHASRVARFIGAEHPDPLTSTTRWGDSILDHVEIAIRDATAGQAGIAALIQEAKVDVIKVPGLMQLIATQAYEDKMVRRFGLAAEGKSLTNALVIDGEEDYQQKQINFANMPEVQRMLLLVVSGAADIPATRFLGQAPLGMNSTGESDIRNYYDRLGAEQELTLRPAIDPIFEAVIRSALGSRPDDVWAKFTPLWQLSEKEEAEIGKIEAEETQIYALGALVPGPVLAEAVRNRLIERGRYPGIEAAYEEFGEEPDLNVNPPDDDDDDDDEDGQAGRTEGQTGGGGRTADAAPRTLYVRRDVRNADDIIAWARGEGFETTLPADDLHVTIAFSRAPIDWMAVGSAWDAEIEIPEGGPRLVERLGPEGEAIVLMFAASELSWRHEEIKRAGASWDWPDYQPHITISRRGREMEIDGIEPYRGKIVLGPEIFEELDEDWKAKVRET